MKYIIKTIKKIKHLFSIQNKYIRIGALFIGVMLGILAIYFGINNLLSGAKASATDPVAYWKFDEGYSSTAYDSSSSGYNASLGTGSSAPTWRSEESCVSGKCLYFDGTDDLVSVGSTVPAIQTVEFWIKPNTSTEYFLDLNGTDYIQSSSGTISVGGFGTYTTYINGVSGATAINTNRWNHIAITTTSGLTGSTVRIGKVSTNFLQGFIDDVKIYNYARSADEIKQDFISLGSENGSSVVLGSNTNLGVNQKQLSEGLVGYWDMEGIGTTGNGVTVPDLSGNGNDGVTSDANASGLDCRTGGKFAGGCTFDGTDDYINIADSNIYRPTTAITVSTWFKAESQTGYTRFISANSTANVGYDLQLFPYSVGGRIQFEIGANSGNIASNVGTNYRDSRWHHVVGTWDGSIMKLYIDGNQQTQTKNVSGSIPYSQYLVIGATGVYSSNYSGSIDEVRIYNRALSSNEVRALYNFAPGPVAHYTFDDGAGQSANDLSGNGNTGTLGSSGSSDSADPTWATGKFGKDLSFDGSNDYISVNNQTLGTSDQVTVTGWVKHQGKSSSSQDIFVKRTSLNNDQFEFRLDSTYKLSFDRYLPSGGSVTSVNTISTNQWTFVAMTLNDSEDQVKFYINGVLDSTNSYTETYSGDSSSTITIGRSGVDSLDGTSDPWRNFNGLIDDVRVYNYARTQSQIIEDMNAGHPAVGTPVGSAVGYWKFDEGYGTTANNSGTLGSTLDGTFKNSPTWSNSGRFNKGILFDGLNDYVNVSSNTAIKYTGGDFTVSLWFNPDPTDNSSNIISKPWNGGGQYNYRLTSSGGANPTPSLNLTGATSYNLSFGKTMSAGAWHQLTFTIDSNALVKLYIDGTLANSGTHTISSWTPGSGDANLSLVIGSLYPYGEGWAGNTGYSAMGTIDEVKIYNLALTEDQIKTDYNQGKGMVFGSTSANTSGVGLNSASSAYCPPGDSDSCIGPVGEWNFDEGTGQSANDTSGNNQTLTLSNSPLPITGKIGKALDFTVASQKAYYSDIPASPLDITNFTLEAWFNRNGLPTNQSRIINKNDTYAIYFESSNSINCYTSDLSPTGLSYSYSTLNSWSHVACTLENGVKNLYINGQIVASTSVTGTVAINDNPLTIGNYSSASDNYRFRGLIDQVKIYNYARTPAQIAWEYNKGAPVAWYKFDECSGATIYNSAINANGQAAGNNGTLTVGASGTQTSAGTCSSGTSTEAWNNGTTGKFNNSMNFDGTDDYVSVGDDASLDITANQDFSLSTWIKRGSLTVSGHFIAKGDDSTSGYVFWLLNSGSSDYINISLLSTGYAATNCTQLNDTNWHNVSVSVSRSSNAIFYIDGVQCDSKNVSSQAATDLSTATSLKIGLSRNGLTYFNGQIDDVRLYNYALTPVQVKILYNDGAVSFK